jgi:antitoxin component of MazEF toxin-antitoxin module
LRVEAGCRVTIPDAVVQTLGLRPGREVEVRFPEMPTPERGLGTAAQWRHLADQRLEDAQVLLSSHKRRINGAVYLGGYGIECSLKAAICVVKDLPTLPVEYRTHDLEALLTATGLLLPSELVVKFWTVNVWSADLRYLTKPWKVPEAHRFLENVREVKQWIEMETSPR